jgi:S-adenosylmethionine:tRNA ribosyltransferase-isomerase
MNDGSSEKATAQTEGELGDYDYELPEDRIAQRPTQRRDASRLLVLHRGRGALEHRTFADLLEYLNPGDLLVLNETRVFPARLRARRATGRSLEVFLLEPVGEGSRWRALARPARAFRFEEVCLVGPGPYGVVPLERVEDQFVVEFREGDRTLSRAEVLRLCEASGEVPLPPYIHRNGVRNELEEEDRERYQTVFARETGAVAAPTAGLHLTAELLAAARSRDISVTGIVLHVGYGTFKPMTEGVFRGSELHAEHMEIGRASGEAILAAKREGRRIVAVGTTSLRAVETFLLDPVLPFRGRTKLFVKPGFQFLGVDALVTNFHLPRSSLLVLVSAFAGRTTILSAYREAIRQGYRFYSYGDAMLIL